MRLLGLDFRVSMKGMALVDRNNSESVVRMLP